MVEAGAPKGVLNVVHGDKVSVDAILDHPDIMAVSFVGSSDIAHYVYSRGTAAGKRVQAMGGAKNHGIILPDADLDQAVKDIFGAAFGSAGERCMALPVVVPVGAKTAETFREKMLAEIETLRVGVSAAHRRKIADYIQLGVEEGAELVVDGRNFALQGYEQGFFIGPTLFSGEGRGVRLAVALYGPGDARESGEGHLPVPRPLHSDHRQCLLQLLPGRDRHAPAAGRPARRSDDRRLHRLHGGPGGTPAVGHVVVFDAAGRGDGDAGGARAVRARRALRRRSPRHRSPGTVDPVAHHPIVGRIKKARLRAWTLVQASKRISITQVGAGST